MTGEQVDSWVPQPLPAPRRHRAGLVAFWVLFGLAAACVIGGLTGMVATSADYTMSGTTMEPAIQSGDRIFVARGQDVRRGDIVVFDVPPGTGGIAPGSYVRRVIGLPGDHVACCDAAGQVTVNGKALDEKQYLYPGDAPSQFRFSAVTGPGEIWVMGDHRSISMDSRAWGRGVPERDIVGRVYMVEHGASFARLTMPPAFAAAGLAASGGRVTWPLAFAALAGAALIALMALGAFGITWRAIRGHRRRRRAYRDTVASGPGA